MPYKDPEQQRAASAAWYAANRERAVATRAAWAAANRERVAATNAAWRAANKKRSAEYRRAREYKMVAGHFDQMLSDQNNQCALCGDPFTDKRKPVVEHCHETGVIRGLTHNTCNSGIGKLDDSAHRVMQALRYLLRSGQRLCDPSPLTTNITAEIASLAPAT